MNIESNFSQVQITSIEILPIVGYLEGTVHTVALTIMVLVQLFVLVSVDKTTLFIALRRSCVREVREPSASVIFAYYGSIMMYHEPLSSLVTTGGVRQGCHIVPCLFNFTLDEAIEGCFARSSRCMRRISKW